MQFIPSSRRDYPRKWLASQAIGGVGVDGEGLSGLEYTFEQRAARHRRHAPDRQGRARRADRPAGDQARGARQGPQAHARRPAAGQGRGRPRAGRREVAARRARRRSSWIPPRARSSRSPTGRASTPTTSAARRRTRRRSASVRFIYEPGSTFKAVHRRGRARGQGRHAGGVLEPAAVDPGRRPRHRGGARARDRRPDDLADPRAVLERRDRARSACASAPTASTTGCGASASAGRTKVELPGRGARPRPGARQVHRPVDGQPADRPGRVGHADAARGGVRRDRQRRRPAPAADRRAHRRPREAGRPPGAASSPRPRPRSCARCSAACSRPAAPRLRARDRRLHARRQDRHREQDRRGHRRVLAVALHRVVRRLRAGAQARSCSSRSWSTSRRARSSARRSRRRRSSEIMRFALPYLRIAPG